MLRAIILASILGATGVLGLFPVGQAATGVPACWAEDSGFFAAHAECSDTPVFYCQHGNDGSLFALAADPDTVVQARMFCGDTDALHCGYLPWFCYDFGYVPDGYGTCYANAALGFYVEVQVLCATGGGGDLGLEAVPSASAAGSQPLPLHAGDPACLRDRCVRMPANAAMLLGTPGAMQGVVCGADGTCVDVVPTCWSDDAGVACFIR
jgi:hypothetical protein